MCRGLLVEAGVDGSRWKLHYREGLFLVRLWGGSKVLTHIPCNNGICISSLENSAIIGVSGMLMLGALSRSLSTLSVVGRYSASSGAGSSYGRGALWSVCL